MKYTVLQLTQAILTKMDSDEVNSIADTSESQSVASILRDTFYDIIALGDLPRQTKLFQLEASLDAERPVTMFLPDNVDNLEWIKYNTPTIADPELAFQPVYPLPLEEFLTRTLNLKELASDVVSYVEIIDGSPFKLLCKKVGPPTVYTTVDDRTLLFDSFDLSISDTLQASQTLCYGEKLPTWLPEDSFIPDLDDKQFQLLLHEAAATCFSDLKQTENAKAERRSRKLWVHQQSAKRKIPLLTAQKMGPNYGRR